MSFACEYCGNHFNRPDILAKHQQTAKYCLKYQYLQSTSKKPTCEICGKTFVRKDALKRHTASCTKKGTIEEKPEGKLLDMIIDLQKTIIELTKRPNNVRNMNLAPITDQELQNHLQYLTIDFIQAGGKGYADWANYYPYKDRIICTDKSRKKLRYNFNDNMVEDGGGAKLAKHFFQAIATRNEEIINTEYRALYEKVDHIAKNGLSDDNNLVNLLTKASHLQEILVKCQQAALGQENDLTKDFVNHLTKLI